MEQERLLHTLSDVDIDELIALIEGWVEMDKVIAEDKVEQFEYSGDVAEAFEALLTDQGDHVRTQGAMGRLKQALEDERSERQRRRQDGSEAVRLG